MVFELQYHSPLNTYILEHRYNEYKKVEALLKKDCAQAGCVSDALLDDTRRKLEETWIAMQGIQPYLKPIRVTSSSVMKSTSFSQENVRSVPLSINPRKYLTDSKKTGTRLCE